MGRNSWPILFFQKIWKSAFFQSFVLTQKNVGLFAVVFVPHYAYGASFACYIAPMCSGGSIADSSCSNICSAGVCPGGSISLPTGYTGSIGSRNVQTKCNSDNRTYSCYCGASLTNVKCASGYYGTPSYTYNGSDVFSGCKKCPSNATCSATDFTCNAGFYKSGQLCVRCGTATGNMSATCAAGSTSITQCYMPKGAGMSDTKGKYTFTTNCYYRNT